MIKNEFDYLVSVLADPFTNSIFGSKHFEIIRFLRIPLDTGFAIMSKWKYIIIDIQTDPITEKQKEEYAKIIGLVAYSTSMPVELYVISTVEETQHMEYVFNEKATFDINVISLKDNDADELFARINPPGSEVTRDDVIQLVFSPLMSSSLDVEEVVTRCVRRLYRLRIPTDFQYIVFILEMEIIERLIDDLKLKKSLVKVLFMRWEAYEDILNDEIEKTKKEIANKMLDEGIDKELVSKIVEIEDI